MDRIVRKMEEGKNKSKKMYEMKATGHSVGNVRKGEE